MSIVKQQGKEVLGVDLSPSVSVKDRCVVHPHVMLNACLSLGRITCSDHEAVSLNSGQKPGSESVHTGGSKDVRGSIGISPKERLTSWQSGFPESAALLGPMNLFLSYTKGDPRQPLIRLIGCVLGIIPQLGRNRFKSSSLPDSENLTEQWQRRDT